MENPEQQTLLPSSPDSPLSPWARVWNWMKRGAKKLKQEVTALYIASSDDRMPLLPKLLAAVVIGYALSPFDLIPDCIPVLGILDDIILLPLGIWVLIRLIPLDLMEDSRRRAAEMERDPSVQLPHNWIAGVIVVLVWICSLGWLLWLIRGWWLSRLGVETVIEKQP